MPSSTPPGSSDSETIAISFTGVLDEHASLPDLAGRKHVDLDLKGMTYLNSNGVKNWCRWLESQTAWESMVLHNCPAIFVRNLSTVRGFMVKGMRIESFLVPYVSDATDERKDVLFRRNIEFRDDGTLFKPQVKDDAGRPMEMDVFEKAYFRFLHK